MSAGRLQQQLDAHLRRPTCNSVAYSEGSGRIKKMKYDQKYINLNVTTAIFALLALCRPYDAPCS